MRIGYIGLGKMGLGQVARLLEKGNDVVVWNRSEAPRDEAKKLGAEIAPDLEKLCASLPTPKVIWLMLPHTIVDEYLGMLTPLLSKGDTVIDGGNSFFENSLRRAEEQKKHGIKFLDVGTSGGPNGARNGACLMIGGEKKDFEKLLPLWKDLSCPDGYFYAGLVGAGHFVKMVHNGIEYGMMQAIGEGFEVMKKSNFNLNLGEVAKIYNKGSVIESRLVDWLEKAYEEYGENLNGISGEISHSGEGEWTVKTAKKLGVPTPIIEESFQFRVNSKGNPSYTGQVVSALRNQFGGHDVADKK